MVRKRGYAVPPDDPDYPFGKQFGPSGTIPVAHPWAALRVRSGGSTMRGTVIRRIRQGARKLLRDQRGNAFMLTDAAVVPLIGIVGSAVDLVRAYMTTLRLHPDCHEGVAVGVTRNNRP